MVGRTGRDKPVLVLQHAAWERPGLVAEALAGLPVRTRTVVSEQAPGLPAAADLGALVVMGGPQDADDDARWPGLRAERRLLADAVAAEVPVLGVCLGMQLLALALGAPLLRRHGTEIGFGTVELLAADPVLDPLSIGAHERATVLHWHSDAVGLPAGATLLASSAVTPVQAFRAGSAIGLQFHIEVGQDLMFEWLGTPEMTTGLREAHVARLRAEALEVLGVLAPRARSGLTAFAEAVRARG